jgi:hypothetical protein
MQIEAALQRVAKSQRGANADEHRIDADAEVLYEIAGDALVANPEQVQGARARR